MGGFGVRDSGIVGNVAVAWWQRGSGMIDFSRSGGKGMHRTSADGSMNNLHYCD